MGSRSSCGMMNQIQKMTMTSGTPRKNSTYIVAGMRIHGACASRARPTKMPSTKPNRMAGMASRRVPPMNGPMPISPWRIRNLKLLVMTETSMRRPGLGRRPHARDQPGDRVAALDLRHDRGDRQAEHEVDQRARRERLEVVEDPVLDAARQEGRHAEIPEEHPHEQRDVPEELDVRGGGPAQGRESHRAQRARQDPEGDGEDPGERGQLQRREQALEQPASRLAGPEHAPLEGVVHLPICFSRYAFTCGVMGYGSSPLGPNHLS